MGIVPHTPQDILALERELRDAEKAARRQNPKAQREAYAKAWKEKHPTYAKTWYAKQSPERKAAQVAAVRAAQKRQEAEMGVEAYRKMRAAYKAELREKKKAADPVGYAEKSKVKYKRYYQSKAWSPERALVTLRRRCKALGKECTLKTGDLTWPTHCPVLGIELDYTSPPGSRAGMRDNLPSIDRFDPRLGYTPENCVVISIRANSLKSNSTLEEMRAVVAYLEAGSLRC